MKQKLRPYIISVAISLGTGLLSALLTKNNMNIYEEITTPPLSPPAFLFPVVWTVLYVLMGISAALVYTEKSASMKEKKTALYFYGASLIFNFLWSILFFNARSFLFAFVWLVMLLALIILTIFSYSKIRRTAAYLQIPYALWVTFAGYLNLAIWLLNR